jgi:cephalosporin hydroxylase
MGERAAEQRLIRGFYEPEGGAWRWTARVFEASLDAPAAGEPAYLTLDCNLPVELMSQVHTATLTARVNGVEIGNQSYSKEGRYLFSRVVPAKALAVSPARVEFELDQSIMDSGNHRELGLIAVLVSLTGNDQTPGAAARALERKHQAYQQVRERRNLPISAQQDFELMRLFHKLPVWDNLWFYNIKIGKNPVDLWVMQDIIWEIRPDFIIETGTFRGGSALFWANVLNGMGLTNSRVITVDISDYTYEASAHPLWKRYIDFYLGSSTDPKIVAAIAKKVKGQKTLVTFDSDHRARHVLRELRMYGPMVSRGSYMVVEDTHMDGVPTYSDTYAGPFEAVLQFLAEGGSQDFEQDVTRERMGMSFNPGGWLRRR